MELTLEFIGLAAGSVSTGLMHATPGEMKSFKSSADRMADIITLRTLRASLTVCVVTSGCEEELVNGTYLARTSLLLSKWEKSRMCTYREEFCL